MDLKRLDVVAAALQTWRALHEDFRMAEAQHHQAHDDPRAVPADALMLGAGGVLPFAALATAALLGLDWRYGLPGGLFRHGLVAYGAVILSFLGGVRWGVALRHGDMPGRTGLLVVSVIPSLAAWVALVIPQPHDLALLIACFLAVAVADVTLVRRGHAPAWYAHSAPRPDGRGGAGADRRAGDAAAGLDVSASVGNKR